MGKQSGLGDNLYVAGYDVSGDIGALDKIGGGPTPLDVTAINKLGMERIGGLRDGSMTYNAFFNPGPELNAAHLRFAQLPTADQIVTYCRGTSLGSPAACQIAKQLNYDGKRGADGSFTFDVEAASNGYGIEWGNQLTAGKRTDATGTNGTGVDLAAATAFGLQAYLQVFAFTGTSVTVKLQESSDNGAGDAWTDVVGGGFVAATAIGAQRIQTARNLAVERWLRVVTSGTFTNAVIAVAVAKNDVAVAF